MIFKFAKFCLVLAVLIFLPAISQVQGAVELDLEKTLRPDAVPMDVAVSPDGKSTFVLTDKGTVLIYDDQGNLKDTIQVGPQIDQIEIGPSGEQLFAASRKNKTVDIILLTFIQEIQTAGSPFKGAENAPVTITVFTDYQCGYCANLAPQLEQLLEKYPGKVKLVHKDFPIRSHRFAFKASMAALAAGKQGKYWEFHDELFKNYNDLSPEKIDEIAKQLGLNEAEFQQDQKNPAFVEQIRQDYEEGIRVGLRGVPTVFINGKIMRQRDVETLESAINAELEKAKGAGN